MKVKSCILSMIVTEIWLLLCK